MLINLKQQGKKATRKCFLALFFFANDMTFSSKNIKYSKKVNFLIMLIILPIIFLFTVGIVIFNAESGA